MLRYMMTAAALKLFSTNEQTKKFYRYLGNSVGAKRRAKVGLLHFYPDRARNILDQIKRHQVLRAGDRVLELGTGWAQWESTIVRMFHDVHTTLFDVWDDRQLLAMKHYFGEFKAMMDDTLNAGAGELQRAHRLLDAVLAASSFEEIYDILNFNYVVNPKGSLEQFEDNSFSMVMSSSVMEHVDRRILTTFINETYRVLKPGGYAVNLIDLGDHLAYYDHGVSWKNYLRYSDKVWERYFQNDVQYFNRVQRPEWHQLFNAAGYELVEERFGEPVPMNGLKVDPQYADLLPQDLECQVMKLIHRKPSA